jgi:hypothetical protein
MHPAISSHLTQAHVADLRDRAQRDTLARATRLARRNQRGHALSRLGAWGRQAQAGLIARRRRLRVDPRRRPNTDSCLPDSHLTIRGRSCPQP